MNRIIKFRAWDRQEKRYRYLDFDDACCPEFGEEDGWLEFRGQFTGALDRNGVEIYEGDILQRRYIDSDLRSEGVFFHAKKCAFYVQWKYDQPKNGQSKNAFCEAFLGMVNIICAVVGNVYEDSELSGRDGVKRRNQLNKGENNFGIELDYEINCKRCKKKGVSQNGYCLRCSMDLISKKLKESLKNREK